MKVTWSKGHYMDVAGVIDKYLLPTFGHKKLVPLKKDRSYSFARF
ncbi:hypothetical protein [Vibrio genomosp. F10]